MDEITYPVVGGDGHIGDRLRSKQRWVVHIVTPPTRSPSRFDQRLQKGIGALVKLLYPRNCGEKQGFIHI